MTNTTAPALSKRKVHKQTKKITIRFHLFVLKNAVIIPKIAPPRQQSPSKMSPNRPFRPTFSVSSCLNKDRAREWKAKAEASFCPPIAPKTAQKAIFSQLTLLSEAFHPDRNGLPVQPKRRSEFLQAKCAVFSANEIRSPVFEIGTLDLPHGAQVRG